MDQDKNVPAGQDSTKTAPENETAQQRKAREEREAAERKQNQSR